MPPDEALKARIAANVALARKQFADLTDTPFSLDRPTIAWLDGYIERMRQRDPNLAGGGLAAVLGSVLGEAIIAAVPGAAWDDTREQGLGVRFLTGDTCFPFAKVDKQFRGGLENGESILSFYDIAVEYVATGKLSQPEAPPPPDPPSAPRSPTLSDRLRRWLPGGRS